MFASWSFPLRAGCSALVALAAVLLAGEGVARAAASARLFYGRAPAVQGCADEAELRRAIAARVGYDPIFPMAPNSVVVSITRDRDQLVADVKLTNREGVLVGSRVLRGAAAQCSELTDTIALTVAIALDSNDKLTPTDPSDGGSAPAASSSSSPAGDAPPSDAPLAPAPLAAPPPVAPASAESAPETPLPTAEVSRTHVELGAGAGGLLGIAPAASFGATGFASLRWPTLEIGVEGWADLPASGAASSSAVAVLPNARVRTSLAGAGSTACLHFRAYFGCAVAFVGSLHAEALDVAGASTGSALEVLGGLRAGAAIPLALGLSLRIALDLLADPARPEVRASGQILWTAPLLAGASQLALVVRIP